MHAFRCLFTDNHCKLVRKIAYKSSSLRLNNPRLFIAVITQEKKTQEDGGHNAVYGFSLAY